jgi:hypothetical protein
VQIARRSQGLQMTHDRWLGQCANPALAGLLLLVIRIRLDGAAAEPGFNTMTKPTPIVRRLCHVR